MEQRVIETRLISIESLPVSPAVTEPEFGSEAFQRLEMGEEQQQHVVNGLSSAQSTCGIFLAQSHRCV